MHDLIYLPLGAAAFGGAERSLLDLSGAMAQRGKKVLILAEEALKSTPFPALARERGVELAWVDWAPERPLRHNLAAALRAFRTHRAPVIHFNIAWRRGMWLIPAVARLATGAKLIGSMRAMPDPHQLVPRRRHFGMIPGLRLWHLPEFAVGRVWAKTLHLTVSINARDFPHRLAAHYGFDPGTIRVIYNGVHIPPALPSPQARETFRRRLGAAPGDFLACYCGRVSPEKGVHHLLAALACLPAGFRLVVAGDGPQRGELEEEAARLGLAPRVRFLGFVEHPEEVMGASDAVVVPSLWQEAFGRVVAEAMGQGVPVVASRVGGMGELFTHGAEGLYVEPGNAQQLTEALADLAADEGRRRAMGERARRLAAERYAMGRVVEQYSGLYQELLAGTGACSPLSP